MRSEEKTQLTEVDGFTISSGNVFEDLGFDEPQEMLIKADLVRAISKEFARRKLSQASLAEVIGQDQPSVSRLMRGITSGYSIERLIHILSLLGQEVTLSVRQKKSGRASATLPRKLSSLKANGAFVAETRNGLKGKHLNSKL